MISFTDKRDEAADAWVVTQNKKEIQEYGMFESYYSLLNNEDSFKAGSDWARAALMPWVRHGNTCYAYTGLSECTCGLSSFLGEGK